MSALWRGIRTPECLCYGSGFVN